MATIDRTSGNDAPYVGTENDTLFGGDDDDTHIGGTDDDIFGIARDGSTDVIVDFDNSDTDADGF